MFVIWVLPRGWVDRGSSEPREATGYEKNFQGNKGDFHMQPMDERYKEMDGKVCLTTQELCDQLGISRKTLSEWEEKGCPKSGRGWWPLWDVLRWRGMIGNGVKSEDDVTEMTLQQKKLKYEAEYKKQKADEAAFENAVARGEYILKEEVTAELQRFFVVLKRSMLGFSRKVANELGSFVDTVTARRIEKMMVELTLDALGQLCIDGIYTATKKKTKA